MDKRVYLKVKIKSLMEEARIIRREEQRAKNSRDWHRRNEPPTETMHEVYSERRLNLMTHRKFVVRPEARATQLAYAYLRGVPYSLVETPGSRRVDWDKVKAMVLKYGFINDKVAVSKAVDAWGAPPAVAPELDGIAVAV